MVSEYQSSKPEEQFLKNLLPLAKQLETLKRTRECKIEFESEKPNFPFKQAECQNEFQEVGISGSIDDNEDLKLQVYEDKDYDIEEIKFWNFVSKNKGIKPNVIRTIVYKVPESSYIIRKVPVIVEEFEEKPKPTDKKDTKPDEIKKDIQTNEKSETKIFNQLIKSNQSNQPKSITSSRKESNEPKFAHPMKYDSEDIILIDEDDDIIGFEEENENEEEKYSITRSNDNNKEISVDEDDDIIEESFIEKNDYTNFSDLRTKQETTEAGDKLSLLQKSFNIQKKPKRGRPVSRPKVVMEKADEPVSTISIKKSSDHDTKSPTDIMNSTNKSMPVISQAKSIYTRKSLNLSKKQDISENLDQFSTSSSSISRV